MSVTVREVVDAVIGAVGEVPGSGVQVYSEDRIREQVERTFDFVLLKYPWEAYMKWLTLTLDGTTGIANADVTANIRGLHDVIKVFRDGSDVGLPRLPTFDNPYLITGTTPKFYTMLPADHASAETRIFQFYPLTATGVVYVKTRIYPTSFVFDAELHMDKTLLVEGVAWMTLADEGLSAESTAKHRELFDMRFADMMKAISGLDSYNGGGTGGIPTEWS